MSDDDRHITAAVSVAIGRIFARAPGPTAAMRSHPSVWLDGNDELVCITMGRREAEGFVTVMDADHAKRLPEWGAKDSGAVVGLSLATSPDATAPEGMTVARALLDERVRNGTHVARFSDGDRWVEIRAPKDWQVKWRVRYKPDGISTLWMENIQADDLAKRCEVVPLVDPEPSGSGGGRLAGPG